MQRTITRVLLAVLTAIVWPGITAHGQIVDKVGKEELKVNSDSIRRAFDSGPYFGLYKDNYFIFGPPIGQRISKDNTNIKFQITVAQRLTRST